MKIKYINSACLEIDCEGFKILTDPWFTQGAYDGSWYHYKEIDPFKYISKPDLIYVSHIHPDHYDAEFLKKIFERFGPVPVIIPDLPANYLMFKGLSDGIELTPTRFYRTAEVEIFVEENDTSSPSDIDSALLVREINTGQTLLNLNDCLYFQDHVDRLQEIIKNWGGNLNLLALGYTGAGPYPQTYYDLELEKDALIIEGNKKKQAFFDRYRKYLECFPAEFNLPFAGEYLLGGHLAGLNYYRGIADAYEIKNIDSKAVVLSTGGTVDLSTKRIKSERSGLYEDAYIKTRCEEISAYKMAYEIDILLELEQINFMRLLKVAATKASKKSEIKGDYHFIFSITDAKKNVQQRFVLDVAKSVLKPMKVNCTIDLSCYSEIIIDYRYLFGLLTTIYHWNNAEVGSQYFTRRVPSDNYQAEVQDYLNFFAVA
jgi:UDP-MurNAc hydroxylase